MKTRKMMKVMTAACLAVLMTAFAGCGKKEAATSGQGGKIEYKLAYHLPADHPLAKGVESFIQKVKEKTHGEVTITAYPAGQLYNDKSMNDAIMTGGVDMGLNTVGRWATVVPEMTDTSLLNAAIAKIGITKKELVKALGLTYAGFWKKLNNQSEFKATEIKRIQRLLHLSDAERDHIFFAQNSD